MVKREGAGLVFQPENAEEIQEKLLLLHGDRKLYDQLKNNCLTAARNYDRSTLAGCMLDILLKYRR
jgi:hypothetical protein